MSKIGRKPINISGLQVEVKGHDVHYKGSNASGVYTLPKSLQAKVDGDFLRLSVVKAFEKERNINRDWGLHRSLLANKILGASKGFERKLKINGLGYKAKVSGKKVVFNLGFSHKIDFELPDGVVLETDKTGQALTLKSADKELVGHVASMIRSLRPPEPYKGTGIKFVEEVIMRKAGKAKAA